MKEKVFRPKVDSVVGLCSSLAGVGSRTLPTLLPPPSLFYSGRAKPALQPVYCCPAYPHHPPHLPSTALISPLPPSEPFSNPLSIFWAVRWNLGLVLPAQNNQNHPHVVFDIFFSQILDCWWALYSGGQHFQPPFTAISGPILCFANLKLGFRFLNPCQQRWSS